MSRLAVERLSAGSSHLNRVARWLNEEWGRQRGFSLAETLEWCVEAAEARNEALFGALYDDVLVGTALLVEHDLETEPHLTPWLSGLYVMPSHRGLDIGMYLIEAVEAAAHANGHPVLNLYCRTGRLARYYHRLGWSERKPTRVDGRPFVIMAKPVNGAG